MCSSDGQRMFEAAAMGSLLAGGPLVAVLGMAYNLSVLGPTSLLGSAVFILFYPTMVSVSPYDRLLDKFSLRGLHLLYSFLIFFIYRCSVPDSLPTLGGRESL